MGLDAIANSVSRERLSMQEVYERVENVFAKYGVDVEVEAEKLHVRMPQEAVLDLFKSAQRSILDTGYALRQVFQDIESPAETGNAKYTFVVIDKVTLYEFRL
jgi:hypothetical protein